MVLVKNILRSSIASIAYLRYLFPEDNFSETQLAGLKIKSLLPKQNPDIEALTNWLEQGVFDAIERHYLRALVFSIFGEYNDPNSLLESYTFKFSYPADGQMSMDLIASAKGADTKEMTYMTREEIQQAWCTMIRSLITLSHTLPPLPSQRHIAMRLFYYDDVTPDDYEPPGFRQATDAPEFEFLADVETVEIGGSVKTKHHAVSLRLDTAMPNMPHAKPVVEDVAADVVQVLSGIHGQEFVSSRWIAKAAGVPPNSKRVAEITEELLEIGVISENKGAKGRMVIRNEEIDEKVRQILASSTGA
jgi:hypothetical protein